MLYHSLIARANELSSRARATPPEPEAWLAGLPARRRQWLDMLGLDPLPPRDDLQVTQTGLLDRGSYVIEKLHFQPLPGCYLGANLYRPAEVTAPLPGVVYVCGHARDGKAWYQPHARWFGEHGYVCLILDTIEIGESRGNHHGVYREGWWQWFSQGYSPAAVEVWYAMRAADLLQARPEVDGSRLGITGNSGGGSISWFTGAADERFGLVAPSCQTGTIEQHARDRTLDGHCDCTVWVNNLGWDLTDVAALIAPRALFVASATDDVLWRPWSNRELFGRVRAVYRALDLEARFGVVEDQIPHGYSPKTRTALFNAFEQHLKGVAAPAAEDIREERETVEDLWAFPGGQPPADDRTPDVHRFFLPLPHPERAALPPAERLASLRAWCFGTIPTRSTPPAYREIPHGSSPSHRYTRFDFETEPGLPLRAWLAEPAGATPGTPIVVAAAQPTARRTFRGQGTGLPTLAGLATLTVEVRGTGDTSIGPGLEQFVRRLYPLLGQSLTDRQVHDLLRAIDLLTAARPDRPILCAGSGATSALALYAGLLEPTVAEVALAEPTPSHWSPEAPELCGILRYGDLPELATLLAPRPLTLVGPLPESWHAAGHTPTVPNWAEWRTGGGSDGG